jgi:hypothetical protein
MKRGQAATPEPGGWAVAGLSKLIYLMRPSEHIDITRFIVDEINGSLDNIYAI